MQAPLLTVVIANYNYGRFLEAAIQSVLSQKDERTELIIIDGGSTDNSCEIIKKYERSLAFWVSERDSGQSEAFNKGFAKAKGRYLTWLNADDILFPGSLEVVLREFDRHPECEWFTGNFFRFFGNGDVSMVGWGLNYYPRILQRKTSPIVVFGPTSFFSKELYEAMGRIDERLHLIMDTDLWTRFIVKGIRQRRIRTLCWGFRLHEDSKTSEFGSHRLNEKQAARLRKEQDIVRAKTGYVASRTMRLLILMWRVFDGSLISRWYLNQTFRSLEKAY